MKRQIVKSTRWERLVWDVGAISGLGLIVLVAMLLAAPVVTEAVAISEVPPSEQASITTNVYASAMISIAVESRADIEITPRSDVSFSDTTSWVRVATNNYDGYTLLMHTVDAEGKLRSSDGTPVEETIDPISSEGVTKDDMPSNTWGYKMEDSDTYRGVSGTDSIIYVSEAATAQNDHALNFGAKIDASLPSGVYSGEVVLSAVANPIKITSLTKLKYMQDMNPSTCEASAVGEKTQLIDTRDGQSYWVEKLADENCWMTQNLALDLGEGGVRILTSGDSDVTNDWTPTSNTNEKMMTGTTYTGADSVTNQYSWNFGKVVYATPSLQNGKICGNNGGTLSIVAGQNLGELCANYGFVDVSGEEWRPTFTAQEGTFTMPDGTVYKGYVAVNQELKTYDAHYLVGNYYQYNTAIAGTTNAVSTGAAAEDTICPKGWTLPVAGPSDANVRGSYAYLFKQYGLMSGNVLKWSSSDYNISKAPLSFVFAGHANPKINNTVNNINVSTSAWSKTKAYLFTLYYGRDIESFASYSPVGTDNRSGDYVGHKVRCLAKWN